MAEDEAIGQRIKTARRKKGMTQAQLADHDKVKVSKNYIYMVESGRTVPGKKLVEDIAIALDVSAKWLLDGHAPMYEYERDEQAAYVSKLLSDNENPLYDMIKAIMQTYSELDGNSQAVIRETVKKFRDNLKNEAGD